MNVKRVLSVILSICMVLSMLTVGVLASSEQCVEFTVETLGLEHQRYTSSATIVSGVAVEWIQLGNYDNGIQMRDKNGNTSMFWNTEALSGGITKIELTYSTSKDVIYSDPDAVIVKFGNEVKGTVYSTTLSTTAVVMTYTITPDADTYRYFYIEHDLAYTMYWDSIKVYYNDDGSETPDTSDDPDTSIEPELVNGYYEIYTADQLYWFAEQVNGGSTSINGKLMADISVNENVHTADGELNGDGSDFRSWTPIGLDYDVVYNGTFDGNGKLVSGLYANDSSKSFLGMFGYVESGGVIKNVGVVGSYLRGDYCVGGVVGYNSGTIINCFNTSIVICSASGGGVSGVNVNGIINNCYNTGSVSGDYSVGGVVGCNHDQLSSVSNCFNSGSVSGGDNVGGVVGINLDGAFSNCYYLAGCAVDGSNRLQCGIGNSTQGSTTADVAGQTTGKTIAQFASGEVCYLLQGEQEEQIWGQTIGTDATPILGGVKVYQNQTGGCNVTSCTYVYSNKQATAVVTHNWTNATCTKPSTCADCGLIEGNALEHDWKAATCTTAKTCSVCGTTSGSALGHKWNEATCTTAKTCSVCGTISGNALGHSWIAATCERAKLCTLCGLTEGEALGHSWAEATCVNPKTCATCGITEGGLLDHKYDSSVIVPGCMSDGYTTYTCKICGHSYRGDYIFATGHSWQEATCTEPMICTSCGATKGDPAGHSFGKTVIHKPAPGVQGYSEHTCTECGFYEKFDFLEYEGVTLSGTITSYLADGNVTLELLQGGKVVYSACIWGSNVSFVIEGVAAGAYVMRISKENHASREYSITVGSEDVTQDAKICPIGDVTGDGMVNIKDFQRMLRHVNESKLLEGYALLCGDVTGDGDVTIKDFQRLLRHVNESKPLF